MNKKSLKRDISLLGGVTLGLGLASLGLSTMVGAGGDAMIRETPEFLDLLHNSSLSKTLSSPDQLRLKNAISALQRTNRLARVERSFGSTLHSLSNTLQKYQENPMEPTLKMKVHGRVKHTQELVNEHINTRLSNTSSRATPMELIHIKSRRVTPNLLARTNIDLRGLSNDQQMGRLYGNSQQIRNVITEDLKQYDKYFLQPLLRFKREDVYTNFLPREIMKCMESLAQNTPEEFDRIMNKTPSRLEYLSDITSLHSTLYTEMQRVYDFDDENFIRSHDFAAHNVVVKWRRLHFNNVILPPTVLEKYGIDAYNLVLPSHMVPAVTDLRTIIAAQTGTLVNMDNFEDFIDAELLPRGVAFQLRMFIRDLYYR